MFLLLKLKLLDRNAKKCTFLQIIFLLLTPILFINLKILLLLCASFSKKNRKSVVRWLHHTPCVSLYFIQRNNEIHNVNKD